MRLKLFAPRCILALIMVFACSLGFAQSQQLPGNYSALTKPSRALLPQPAQVASGKFTPPVHSVTLRDLEKSSTTNLAKADFEALGTMVGKLGRVLSGPKVNTQAAAAWIDSLALLKKDLDRDDANIRARFASIREKIVKAKLPANILIRHDEFVKRYEGKRKQVEGALGVVLPKDSTLALDVLASTPAGDLRTALVAIEGALKSEGKRPLSPKQKKGSGLFSNVYRPIKRERMDPFGGKKPKEMKTFASNPPTPEDTMETPDVQFTKELRDLADTLGHDPRRIYEYVKNRVSFQAYHGSLKGARSTYIELSGNDYDQASLLIALLRISKIPARYRIGVLELTPEKLANWLGVDDFSSGSSVLRMAGIPYRYVKGENGPRFWVEQCWVAAYVPMQNYMGAPIDQKGKAWVPFLPAFKDLEIKPGLDVPGLSGFDGMAFFGAYIDSGRTQSPMVLYRSMLQGWLDVNHPGVKYEDTFRRTSVKFESFPILPFTDPYREVSVKGEFSGLADSLRYTFEISLDQGGFDHTTDFVNVANRSVVVSYSGATVEDSLTIVSFGGIFNTPPYLVRLRPVLWVGGKLAEVGTGEIGMGNKQSVYIGVSAPGQTQESVEGEMVAGGFRAVALAGQALQDPEFTRAEPESLRDYFSYSLNLTARRYLASVDQALGELDATLQTTSVREVTEINAMTDVEVKYLYGAPYECKWRGTLVDPGWSKLSSVSVDGTNPAREDNAGFLGITMMSYEMGGVLEREYSVKAVSPVTVLAMADSLGVGVTMVNLANMNEVLPKLAIPFEVKDAIKEELLSRNLDEIKVASAELEVLDWKGGAFVGFSSGVGLKTKGGEEPGVKKMLFVKYPFQGGGLADYYEMPPFYQQIVDASKSGHLMSFTELVEVPETLSCYLKGERFQMRIRWNATFDNAPPIVDRITRHPGENDYYDTSVKSPRTGWTWDPGKYAVWGDRYENGKLSRDFVRKFMLATVKLVLDSDGNFDDDSQNNPGYHFDDNQNFTPKGTTDNPVVNKLIAVLWADKEPYRKENWDQFHVDLTEWSGRVLPKLTITHDPTNLKGWCTNMGDGTEADYVLESEGLPKEFNPDGTVRLDLGCYDYGGLDKIMYGFIRPGDNKAIVYPIVSVPVDDDNDGMADAWERGNGGTNLKPDEDNDGPPGYKNSKGDGLKPFDEYRGFWCIASDGVNFHVRTKPLIKTVFIQNEPHQQNSSDMTTFRLDSGLEVLEIDENGWTGENQRVINKNRKDPNAQEQKGIWLKQGIVGNGRPGGTMPVDPNGTGCPNTQNRWTPNLVVFCMIDIDVIADAQELNVNLGIKQMVAHELGHAVGMLDRYGNYNNCNLRNPPAGQCDNHAIMGDLPNEPNLPYLSYEGVCEPPDLSRFGCQCLRGDGTDLKSGDTYNSKQEIMLLCPQ